MRAPKYSFVAVVVRDAFGTPHAYPVVLLRSKRKVVSAKLVLTFEERMDLDRVCRYSGGNGLDWCAGVTRVRDRSDEGGRSISLEVGLGCTYRSAETLAVDTQSIVVRLPVLDVLYAGTGGQKRPTRGMCWSQSRLIEAVHAAHALVQVEGAS